MSKWENKREFEVKQPAVAEDPRTNEAVTHQQERIIQWTFELSKVLLANQKTSISAIPGAAYHLALDIESYLRSVGLLPGLPEKK